MSENKEHCGDCDWHIVKSQNERLCMLDGKVYPGDHHCKHWRIFNIHNRVDKQRHADDYMRRMQEMEIAEKRLQAEGKVRDEDKEVREEERKFQRLMAIVDRILAFFEGLIARLLRPGGGS